MAKLKVILKYNFLFIFPGLDPSFLKLRSIHKEAQQFFRGNLKFEFKYIPRGGGGYITGCRMRLTFLKYSFIISKVEL